MVQDNVASGPGSREKFVERNDIAAIRLRCEVSKREPGRWGRRPRFSGVRIRFRCDHNNTVIIRCRNSADSNGP